MATMRPRAPQRTLDGFSLVEKMALVSGWLPPGQGGPHPGRWRECRWQSWSEYLHDFEQVEGELRQHFAHLRREPFAHLASRYRDQHGAAALAVATYEQITYGHAD